MVYVLLEFGGAALLYCGEPVAGLAEVLADCGRVGTAVVGAAAAATAEARSRFFRGDSRNDESPAICFYIPTSRSEVKSVNTDGGHDTPRVASSAARHSTLPAQPFRRIGTH